MLLPASLRVTAIPRSMCLPLIRTLTAMREQRTESHIEMGPAEKGFAEGRAPFAPRSAVYITEDALQRIHLHVQRHRVVAAGES